MKTTIYWEPEVRDALTRLAANDGRSLNDYTMRVLKEHVEQQSKETER